MIISTADQCRCLEEEWLALVTEKDRNLRQQIEEVYNYMIFITFTYRGFRINIWVATDYSFQGGRGTVTPKHPTKGLGGAGGLYCAGPENIHTHTGTLRSSSLEIPRGGVSQ